MTIDLQPFCSTDELRYYLMKPWSRGEFTYATNGHVAVRVQRCDDIAENADAPDVSRLGFTAEGDFVAVPESPVYERQECEICNDSGFAHPDCPNCDCQCVCGGNGAKQYVNISESRFDLRYVAQLRTLPNCKIRPIKNDQSPFIFDGGCGVLMPIRQ